MKKTTKVEKVVQFKSCTESDIADAVLTLARPLLDACANDQAMQELLINLAVEGWNLSLFAETEETYAEKIEHKLPETLPDDKKQVFIAFIKQVITNKQKLYGGMNKGITSHSASFEDGTVSLTVKALPVNPKHI